MKRSPCSSRRTTRRQIREFLEEYFSQRVCPVLTPLAFDPGHPFPYISNRSKSFAVVVESDGRTRFARVKVPDVLPRFVAVPPPVSGRRGLTFALLEDVIRLNLGQLFPGMDIVDAHLFRVIRETDIVLQEEEAVDLLESVDQGLRDIRHGPLSLLQVDAGMPARVLDILIENFEIERDVVMRSSARLGFADWMSLTSVERPKLKDAPFVPRTIWHRQDAEGIFEQIKYRDTLLHHPFDSFTTFEAFLDAAVDDEQVVAIKMTLYRVGHKSPLVERLMAAAEAGKQVAVLVELKARFDERSNIGWASRLEEAGVHVVYGLMNLKTHCKLCLVVRKDGDAIPAVRPHRNRQLQSRDVAGLHRFRIVHRESAHRRRRVRAVQLSDRLFEADDLSRAHRRAGGASRTPDGAHRARSRAPAGRPACGHHHQEQRHLGPGHHPGALCARRERACPFAPSRAASAACGPALPVSATRSRSARSSAAILEHSRVYYFENGGEPVVYLGSADLMERNLDRRVETLCPVLDPDIARFIRHTVLEAYLNDTERASVLWSDGTYHPPTTRDAAVDAQQLLVGDRPVAWPTCNCVGTHVHVRICYGRRRFVAEWHSS